MTQIQLFNKFKDEHREVNLSINTTIQHKPWYVRPITIRDTCCFRYHVEFELYYDTFLRFGKTFGRIHFLPQFVLLYLKFYVKEIVTRYFTTKDMLVERNVIIVEI